MKYIALAFTFLLIGCSAMQTHNSQALQQSQTIALAINFDDTLTFAYTGLTAFGNECTHSNISSWGFAPKLAGQITAQLQSIGKKVVPVHATTTHSVWSGADYSAQIAAAKQAGADTLLVVGGLGNISLAGGEAARCESNRPIFKVLDEFSPHPPIISLTTHVVAINAHSGEKLSHGIIIGQLKVGQDTDEMHPPTLSDPWKGVPISKSKAALEWKPGLQAYSQDQVQFIGGILGWFVEHYDIRQMFK